MKKKLFIGFSLMLGLELVWDLVQHIYFQQVWIPAYLPVLLCFFALTGVRGVGFQTDDTKKQLQQLMLFKGVKLLVLLIIVPLACWWASSYGTTAVLNTLLRFAGLYLVFLVWETWMGLQTSSE